MGQEEDIIPQGSISTVDFNLTQWYEIFISIIFGVFISVWIQPFSTSGLLNGGPSLKNISSDIGPKSIDCSESPQVCEILKNVDSNLNMHVNEMVHSHLPNGNSQLSIVLLYILSGVMFLILICLWWWYAAFFSKYGPAETFLMYSYDFISLGIFALAFRSWDQRIFFYTTIIVGAVLVFIRVYKLKGQIEKNFEERKTKIKYNFEEAIKAGRAPNNYNLEEKLQDIEKEQKNVLEARDMFYNYFIWSVPVIIAISGVLAAISYSGALVIEAIRPHFVIVCILIGFLSFGIYTTMQSVRKIDGGFFWIKP